EAHNLESHDDKHCCFSTLPARRVCDEIDEERCKRPHEKHEARILRKLKGRRSRRPGYLSKAEQLCNGLMGIPLFEQLMKKESIVEIHSPCRGRILSQPMGVVVTCELLDQSFVDHNSSKLTRHYPESSAKKR